MATIEQQREQDERNAMIEQLRAARASKAAELARIDEKLAAATDADFMARVGTADLKTLSVRERSEIVSKIGPDRFAELVLRGSR
jgi:hypothetical protein